MIYCHYQADWHGQLESQSRYLMVAAAEKTTIIMGVLNGKCFSLSLRWSPLQPPQLLMGTSLLSVNRLWAEDEDDHADDEHSIDGFNLSCGRNWKDNHMSMGEQPANVNDNNNRVGF